MTGGVDEERRWRALKAAALVEATRGLRAEDVLETARKFEAYLRDGEAEG